MTEPKETPDALWHCIKEPDRLTYIARWFEETYDVDILDEHSRIRSPARRLQGHRVYKTPVAGITVTKQARQHYAVYESRELYEQRQLWSSWSKFLSGSWVLEVPTEPGMYFVRSLEGYQSVHTIVQLEDDVLHDTNSGFVPRGQVTTWRGAWFSQKIPLLTGAK